MSMIRLDLQFFAQEKTEQATPKKKQDARKKGQVAKSADINTALVLLVVFLFFWFANGSFHISLLALFTESFTQYFYLELTESSIQQVFIELSTQAAVITAPIMLVAMLGGVAANYAQVGSLFSTEAIQMKLERLDPIKGAKRIFSVRAIVELLKSVLKISLVGGAACLILWLRKDELLKLPQKNLSDSLGFIVDTTIIIGLASAIILLFIAILDYVYQKFDHEKQLRMSKQDIKDEYKKSEGDPLIKSKIKEKQRQMAMRRMMQEVPNADVVITNPTHYAVALKYDEKKLDAPYVVAKGVDFVALKIIDIAKKQNVMTVENRPLARALYGQAEIGDPIPEEYFQAIAEILAYVYRTKNT